MSNDRNFEGVNKLKEDLQHLQETVRTVPVIAESRIYGSNEKVSSQVSDLTDYRLEQAEKRYDALDARMARIESGLGEIKATLAGLSTKEQVRGWGMGLIAIMVATGIGVAALVLASSANQLSAFQSGLTAVQTVVAVKPK